MRHRNRLPRHSERGTRRPAPAPQWEAIVKIDAGAGADAESTAAQSADDEPNDAGARSSRREGGNRSRRNQPDPDLEVQDSGSARGWVRAKLVLQEELQGDESDDGSRGDGGTRTGRTGGGQGRDRSAPVPVENGLVITGTEENEGPPRSRPRDSEPKPAADEPATSDDSEPLDEASASRNGREGDQKRTGGADSRKAQSSRKDGSRRDGSSRGAAARARPGSCTTARGRHRREEAAQSL